MTFDPEIFLQQLFSLDYVHGALISVAVAIISLIVASIIGFFLAVGTTSKSMLAKRACGVYIWFFRAIPALLLLLIAWNALPQLIPALRQDWYNPFIATCLALGLAEGAYMAEVIRSALISIDSGQTLAARAIGLSPWRVMQKVVIPQAIRIALPPTGNELIGLIKYSSLASVISLRELLTTAQVGVSTTFRYTEYYSAAIIYYLIIVSIITFVQSWIEKKYHWTTKVKSTKSFFGLKARKEFVA